VRRTAYLAKHGDDAKVAKHAFHVQAQGAQFLPASFSILGAWGPAITARFDALWATEIQKKAADNGDSTWPVIRRKLDWRGKVSVTLMRANAQMLLSRATRQGALCPAHAHRARIMQLPAHTSPAQAIPDRRNLAHSRSLCGARHGASACGV
jgi:hypothetical protein